MTSRRSAGYTLTEAMLVVAILGIVVSGGAQLLIQVQRYFMLTKTRTALQQQARAAMYVITRELRQAQNATITVDQAAGQPFYSRITFNKINDSTAMQFYQSGGNLIQKRGNNVTTLSTNLIYLAFSLPRSDSLAIISVDLTLQQAIFQGQIKALHMASEKVQVMN